MPPQLQTKSYFPSGGLNSDTNSLFVKDSEFVGVNNLRIKPNQIQTRNGCKQLGGTVGPGSGNPVLHFHTFKVPNGKELYFAFTKNCIYKYDVNTSSWLVSVDSSLLTGTNNDKVFTAGIASFWSTTDYIDTTLGSTVIAACSAPVNDISEENDQASRKLLYYSVSDGYFKTLTLKENIDITDEDTGTVGYSGTYPHQQVVTYTLSKITGTNVLYPGSFSVGTDELGTIAYSDNTTITVSGKSAYKLIPLDQTRVQAGDLSYILVDGTALSINWLAGDFAGLKLKVNYTYQMSSYILPRYVKNYYNRLLLGNTCESDAGTSWVYYPWRVRWSEVGVQDKIIFTSYQDLVEIDTGGIMGWEEQGFYLTILKRNTVYKCSHIGGDSIFLFQAAWRQGSPSGRTLETFNGMQYFVGDDDIYQWDGNSLSSITVSKDTGNFRVKNTILSKITFYNSLTIFSSLDYSNKEYCIWIPQVDSTLVFVYSIPYDTWTMFTYSVLHYSVGYGRVEIPTSASWANAVGSWATQNNTWSEAVEGLDQVQFFGCSGKVYANDENLNLDYATLGSGKYTGTSITSYLITKDFIFSDVYRMDRTQRVELDLYGTSATIGWNGAFSQNSSDFKAINTLTLTPVWERRYYYPDAVTYQIRFCLSSESYIGFRLMNVYALDTRLTNR